MKKLQILAAVLAIGTMCMTGCNMGGTPSNDKTAPETRNIVLEDGSEETPAPCPDDNCNRGKMPFKKPGFKFKVPHGRHKGNGRENFRRPHKRPAPAPEPENPETPEDSGNN